MATLAAEFCAVLGGRVAASPALEASLTALIARGRARWPDLAVDDATLARRLAASVAGADDPVAALAALHVEDLHLACACGLGLPAAVAAFDRELLGQVPVYLGRVDGAAAVVDEVKQILREKLLVGTLGSPAKIHDYDGHGPLGAWVRVAALRDALQLLRRQPGGVAEHRDVAEKALAASPGPDVALIKARHQGEFQAALDEALAQLTLRERTLLRMHFLDGMSIDKIGVVYRVHRATAARWIQTAREGLFDRVRQRLREQLRLSASEVDSLIAMVQSQLQVSLSHAFGHPPG